MDSIFHETPANEKPLSVWMHRDEGGDWFLTSDGVSRPVATCWVQAVESLVHVHYEGHTGPIIVQIDLPGEGGKPDAMD